MFYMLREEKEKGGGGGGGGEEKWGRGGEGREEGGAREKLEVLFQARRVGVICPTAALSLLGPPGPLGAGQALISS